MTMLRRLSLLPLLLLAPEAAAVVSCTIGAPTLDFGAYSIVAQDTTTTTITVTCTRGAVGDTTFNYQVRMTAGGGTFAARTMAVAGQTLTYNIYRDLANTQIWGDGTGGSTVHAGTFNFSATPVGTPVVIATLTAYGTLPAHSLTVANDKPPNTYTRNITVRVRRTFPTPAANLTPTATMQARAVISPACAIAANSTLAFGSYDPSAATPTDATATIGFRCTLNSIFDIGLGGTVGARTMAGPGGDTLAYELYSDAGRTVTWGNAQDTSTIAADDAADTTGNGISTLNTAQSRTVYGRIPAGQDVNAGSYSNTVTITIYY